MLEACGSWKACGRRPTPSNPRRRQSSTPRERWSAPPPKKDAKQFGCFLFSYPAINFRRMMARRLSVEAASVLDAPAFLIRSREIKSANPRERNSSRAHSAGLKRNIEVARRQALAAYCCASGSNREHFRVGGRVPVGEGSVVRLRQDFASFVRDDDRSDRHFAESLRLSRLREG